MKAANAKAVRSLAFLRSLGLRVRLATPTPPAWAFVCLLASFAPAASAAVWAVALGQSLTQAVQKAADGDVVELQAGVHTGQVAVVTQRSLTLRGVGGVAVLQAADQHAEGKAILVVRNGHIRVENIEFRGARVPDRNGAGIRFERGQLEVFNCRFIDNENGILAGNWPQAELRVVDSEFGQAPAGTPLPHLIYVGRIARFELRGSHVWGGQQGHLVKSRARVNEVLFNRLVDGEGGQAAYELEFPNGGQATVVGNVIGQSAHSSNAAIVSFGAEGDADGPAREHELLLVNNTVLNSGSKPAIFVRLHQDRLQSAVQQRWVNNLFVGLGFSSTAWQDLTLGNVLTGEFSLIAPADGDFGLKPDSWFVGKGVAAKDLVDDRMAALLPRFMFTQPLGTRPLVPGQLWSPGAVQP